MMTDPDFLDICQPDLPRRVGPLPAAYLQAFRLAQPGRRVLLFSGHLLDAPGRQPPRFPASQVPAAEREMAAVLARMQAGPGDVALTQGACGGDLLFTAACQARGVAVWWLQPFDEADFLAASVARCGEDWLARYATARAGLAGPIRSAPQELGPLAAGSDAYQRCNLWLLYSALASGPVRFVCLWNGGRGGKGGTAHMVNEVQRWHGQVDWIDTRRL